MELIIQNDGLYQLVPLTKQMMDHLSLLVKVDGALPGQWSSLLLELNLMKRAWKSYGVDITMKAPGLKNVLTHGTRVNDGSNTTKRRAI